MKKLIIAATVTACIALCAAVWARNEVIEKTTHTNTDSCLVRHRSDQREPRSGRRTYADRG